MKSTIAAALGSKVAIGVGATALAFGTAGTVLALQPVSDSSSGRTVAVDEVTTTTTSTTVLATTTTTAAPSTTTTTAHDADDDHGRHLGEVEDEHGVEVEHEHPENHGKVVSEAAHARNEARHDHRGDDHGGDDHGGDDHGGDRGRSHGEDD